MKLPKPPPIRRKHIEERNKLFAGGCQLLALAMFGAGLLAPLFNQTLIAPLSEKIVIGLLVGLSESAAFAFLRYIPFPDEP